MRKEICIKFSESVFGGGDLNMSLRQIMQLNQSLKFNPNYTFIKGITYDFTTGIFRLFLQHNEFPEIMEAECCQEFYLEHAKIKFPYLFYDTNPLLYRQFHGRDVYYEKKGNGFMKLFNMLGLSKC